LHVPKANRLHIHLACDTAAWCCPGVRYLS
jgi:hypothetical protein